MKTFRIYISHNAYGGANPSAISQNSNEVVFDINRISTELKSKIYGKVEILDLTKVEIDEIFNARITVRRVGFNMMKNIGMID